MSLLRDEPDFDVAIARAAQDLGNLDPSFVEKDYWVTHALCALARDGFTVWFKGGTSLRKCHFKEYRFSQDLDYTCRKELPPDRLEPLIRNACRNATHMSGVGFELVEFKKLREVSGAEAFNARVEYRGPSNHSSSLPRIQFDLTYYEEVVLPPEDRKIFHFYSDSLRGARAWSYSLDEILAEKMRSVLQQRERVLQAEPALAGVQRLARHQLLLRKEPLRLGAGGSAMAVIQPVDLGGHRPSRYLPASGTIPSEETSIR